MRFVKQHLAAVMAGLVIVGGASYVMAAEPSAPDDEVTLAQNEGGPEGGEDGAERPGRHAGPLPRAIRGEFTAHAREGDGFVDVRFDRGVLDHVEGTTVVINEDDGTTVEVPTDDETRISRDGEDAELAELVAGDHVAAYQANDGDGFVTKGIRAISAERWAEFEEKREECREQPVRCRHHRRERFRDRRDDGA
jgi:hypothetical protein